MATDDEVGSACDDPTAGGTRLRAGLDDGLPSGQADNGQLEAGEIDTTAVVCNGAAGAGKPGHASLLEVDMNGGTACPTHSGYGLVIGIDDGSGGGNADNGRLETGEITFTQSVCDGANGSVLGGGCAGGDDAASIVWAALILLALRMRRRPRP